MTTTDRALRQIDHDYGYARAMLAWRQGHSIIVNPMPPGTGAHEGWDRARREIALDIRGGIDGRA